MAVAETKVNTKTVEGRRAVRYESYADLLEDAERVAANDARTIGNWSKGQIFEHLARALNASIDGQDFVLPAPMRVVMTVFMKRRFLNRGIMPGIKGPEAMMPGDILTVEGLDALRKAIGRQETEQQRASHPVFGKRLSNDEWEKFNLRHAELHMSFIVEE